MAGITVSHLSFTYPQETVPALRDVSFSVEEGEFLTLIGPSGGGKSTLLRALKPALTPHGSFTGEISFFGEPLSALDARRQAAEIGFVLQKPDDQIVTDRVWHELAFGMESLGFASREKNVRSFSAPVMFINIFFSALRNGSPARWRPCPADRSSF